MKEKDIMDMMGTRTFEELTTSGLLWLINASVFHPRGFSLALVMNEAGDAVGWMLTGDGTESITINDRLSAERFRAARLTFNDSEPYDAAYPKDTRGMHA